MLAIGLRWRNLNRRQNRPRQIKRERGAQQADHDRERQIEACAGAWQLGIVFNAFRGLGEAPAGDHDGNDADDDERKPGPIGEAFAMRGELALGQLRRRDFEEQIEPLDDKTEGHHRNGGAHPGQKGALVGGVVALTLDHGKPRHGGGESKAACSWPRSSAVATQRILLPVRRLEDRRGVGEPDAGVGVLKTGEKYAKFNIAAVNGLKYLRIK